MRASKASESRNIFSDDHTSGVSKYGRRYWYGISENRRSLCMVALCCGRSETSQLDVNSSFTASLSGLGYDRNA